MGSNPYSISTLNPEASSRKPSMEAQLALRAVRLYDEVGHVGNEWKIPWRLVWYVGGYIGFRVTWSLVGNEGVDCWD